MTTAVALVVARSDYGQSHAEDVAEEPMQCPDEIAPLILEIIHIACDSIRQSADNPDYCRIEANHVHNLHQVFKAYSASLVEYYWKDMRKWYLEDMESIQGLAVPEAYEAVWSQLRLHAERRARARAWLSRTASRVFALFRQKAWQANSDISPGNAVSFPPEPLFSCYLAVLRDAIFWARDYGGGSGPPEKIVDLMDAIHIVPALLGDWQHCSERALRPFLEDYDRKWAKTDKDFSLVWIFERTYTEKVFLSVPIPR